MNIAMAVASVEFSANQAGNDDNHKRNKTLTLPYDLHSFKIAKLSIYSALESMGAR